MDYCYTCRRILNGALVCPGCGGYAPEIAESLPPDTRYRAAYAGAPDGPYGDGVHDGTYGGMYGGARGGHPGAYENTGFAGGYDPGPSARQAAGAAPGTTANLHGLHAAAFDGGAAPLPAALPDLDGFGPDGGQGGEGPGGAGGSELGPSSLALALHSGRAARRRQVERWRKTRRRAGVATAVALFGGGVTVASMNASGGKGATTSADAKDDVVPVTLSSDAGPDSIGTPNQNGGPSGTRTTSTHTVNLSQHTFVNASYVPNAQPTHPVADSGGTVPIASADGAATGYSSGYSTTQTVPRGAGTATAPPSTTSTTTTTSTTDGGAGGGGGGGGGGTTTTSTPPPATAPSTPPPTTTAPSTPPPRQLCVLIICLG